MSSGSYFSDAVKLVDIPSRGKVWRKPCGCTPRKGPLSPLLGNIMLMDKTALERRNYPFVRYADDCLIFCKSEQTAECTKDNIIRFIEIVLYLRVNWDKAYAGYAGGVKFLGYGFYMKSGECRLCLHPRAGRSSRHAWKRWRLAVTGWVTGYSQEYKKNLSNNFIFLLIDVLFM